MNTGLYNIYLELRQWRDEEIGLGNIEKARKIQKVMRRKISLIRLRKSHRV